MSTKKSTPLEIQIDPNVTQMLNELTAQINPLQAQLRPLQAQAKGVWDTILLQNNIKEAGRIEIVENKTIRVYPKESE